MLDNISRVFISECLFNESVFREGWLIWAEIDSMVEAYNTDPNGIVDSKMVIPISEYSLYHRVAEILPKVLGEKIRSLEAMGELVIWYLVLHDSIGVNNVERAKEMARHGMRYFRNTDNVVVKGRGEKKFTKIIKDMMRVPSRCAAIRLLAQRENGSMSNLSSIDLIKISVEIENKLIFLFNNLSKHATERPQTFGDPKKWIKLSPAMQGLATSKNPSVTLESLLAASWQMDVVRRYSASIEGIDEYIRRVIVPIR